MILLVSAVLAAPQLWLEGAAVGQAGVAEPLPLGGGVAGELGVVAGAITLSAGASEALLAGDPAGTTGGGAQPGHTATVSNPSGLSHAAGIYVDVRWPSEIGPYVLGGFAHQHVTPLSVLAESPGAVILASHDGVTHRSGLSVGAGYVFPSFWEDTPGLERVHAEVRARLMVLPFGEGPLIGGIIELGGRIRVGKGW